MAEEDWNLLLRRPSIAVIFVLGTGDIPSRPLKLVGASVRKSEQNDFDTIEHLLETLLTHSCAGATAAAALYSGCSCYEH